VPALIAFLMSFVACSMAHANSQRYMANDIRDDIIGKRVFLSVPFGGEFPLNYRSDGKVDGSGEALGLGRFVKPEDRGRWWIEADRLCQQFETWYDGEPMCFELYRLDAKRLRWIRNNGQTGTARIGPSL
jgi:hypothetical protein